jgi:hypothetical protein
MHEKLQNSIRAPATDFEIVTSRAKARGLGLQIVDLKADMAKQAARGPRRLIVEEFQESPVPAIEEDAVDLARGILELVRDLAVQHRAIEFDGTRQIGRAKGRV